MGALWLYQCSPPLTRVTWEHECSKAMTLSDWDKNKDTLGGCHAETT